MMLSNTLAKCAVDEILLAFFESPSLNSYPELVLDAYLESASSTLLYSLHSLPLLVSSTFSDHFSRLQQAENEMLEALGLHSSWLPSVRSRIESARWNFLAGLQSCPPNSWRYKFATA
eukprot:Lithocolla_globosa_v1_NODE_76_length_6846_cov_31.756737.p5 type:complete len:118 gc:universal NODE_76_length_6846_cov_31.756737:6444-6797(+)